MSKEPARGRPPLPKGAVASSQIQLRVSPTRKASYVRTASSQGKTLAAWMMEICDKAVSAK